MTLSISDPIVANKSVRFLAEMVHEQNKRIRSVEHLAGHALFSDNRVMSLESRIDGLQRFILNHQLSFAAATGGAKVIAKIALATTAKEASFAVGKTSLKTFPVVGLIVGISLAFFRYHKGDDWKLVVGELVSGTCSLVPVVGTSLSIGCDVALAAADVATLRTAGGLSESEKEALIQEYLALIGIDYHAHPDITQAMVDAQCRSLLEEIHPDRNEHTSAVFEHSTHLLGRIKQRLYELNGWETEGAL